MSSARLVESAAYVWLLPVRGSGPRVHYVKSYDGVSGRSLCGQSGPLDARNRARFSLVRGGVPSAICNACLAEACREPSRVAWS